MMIDKSGQLSSHTYIHVQAAREVQGHQILEKGTLSMEGKWERE